MAKKYKVLVSDTVPVPLNLTVKDEDGKDVARKVTLICQRTSASEIQAEMADQNRQLAPTLRRVVKGWRDQNMVQDEDTGAPAEFSPEALDVLLETPNLATLAFVNYMKEVGAKEKN